MVNNLLTARTGKLPGEMRYRLQLYERLHGPSPEDPVSGFLSIYEFFTEVRHLVSRPGLA
ncbi:hypothetical protein AGR8A_Lc10175 [Agrobacterium fabrum str. J-07]|nr:hypothetical protein AGR8A_Lc10175 [Agrobacterium fabrum str. J-07]